MVSTTLKHNLITPDVIAFFVGVPESEEVTKECAFPLAKPNTNLNQSIFKYIGQDWTICFDGVFRKCQKIKCNVLFNSINCQIDFYIDNSIRTFHIDGILVGDY